LGRAASRKCSTCARPGCWPPSSSPRAMASSSASTSSPIATVTTLPERDFFIDNLLVRIHSIIEMIWWNGLAPSKFPSTVTACDGTVLASEWERCWFFLLLRSKRESYRILRCPSLSFSRSLSLFLSLSLSLFMQLLNVSEKQQCQHSGMPPRGRQASWRATGRWRR